MSDITSKEITPKLPTLSLVNLSLGFAFILSSIFSTGAKILWAMGLMLNLRILQPYQTHAINVLASYWLPAILIFIVLRVSRLDSKLRPTTAIHTTILIANILLTLYVTVRIFASTVEGGGASFVVASMSPIIIIPAWILLAIGFIKLIINSSKVSNTSPTLPQAHRFSSTDLVALGFALVAPIAYGFTLPVEKMYAAKHEFSSLCEHSEIKVLEKVKGAKSIALLNDSFTFMAQGRQAETRPMAVFLLNQSLLEYIERPATDEGLTKGIAKYERMSTAGKRVLRSLPGDNRTTQYIYEPTDAITAEYEVKSTVLNIDRGDELGLGGARIEIRRKTNNHLIGYAQYYWNNKEFRACPEESHNGMFIYHFIADALNVKNPEGPKDSDTSPIVNRVLR